MTMTQTELSDFANGMASGFIKPWKANSMTATLIRSPEIVEDRERLGKYVKNCLSMEGFSAVACDGIAQFIYEKHN